MSTPIEAYFSNSAPGAVKPSLVACLLVTAVPVFDTVGNAERAGDTLDPGPVLEVPVGAAQLFIGDRVIECAVGMRRTLHQPQKDNGGERPVIFLEDEFEGVPGTQQAGTIIYDPKLQKYVMFAGAGAHLEGRPWDYIRLFRFTSDDGLNWIKGDNGEPEWVFPRSREDFLDPDSGEYATNFDLNSFYYDQRDQAYPYKGWICFANWGGTREGLYYVHSSDGKTWERVRQIAVHESYHW